MISRLVSLRDSANSKFRVGVSLWSPTTGEGSRGGPPTEGTQGGPPAPRPPVCKSPGHGQQRPSWGVVVAVTVVAPGGCSRCGAVVVTVCMWAATSKLGSTVVGAGRKVKHKGEAPAPNCRAHNSSARPKGEGEPSLDYPVHACCHHGHNHILQLLGRTTVAAVVAVVFARLSRAIKGGGWRSPALCWTFLPAPTTPQLGRCCPLPGDIQTVTTTAPHLVHSPGATTASTSSIWPNLCPGGGTASPNPLLFVTNARALQSTHCSSE